MMYPNLSSFCLFFTFDNYRFNFYFGTDVPFLRLIPWINHNRFSYGDLLNLVKCIFLLALYSSAFLVFSSCEKGAQRTFVQLSNRSMLFAAWIIFKKFSIKDFWRVLLSVALFFNIRFGNPHTEILISVNNCQQLLKFLIFSLVFFSVLFC